MRCVSAIENTKKVVTISPQQEGEMALTAARSSNTILGVNNWVKCLSIGYWLRFKVELGLGLGLR